MDTSKKSQEMVGKEAAGTSQSAEAHMPENTSTPEPTEESYEVIEKRNIDIAGRHYKYVVYARTTSGKITLMSLKTDEDVLHIPSEIEGNPVVMLGWPEETPGVTGYQWSDQVKSSKLGWNWGKKLQLKRAVILDGIERIEDLHISADEVIIPRSVREIGMYACSYTAIKK